MRSIDLYASVLIAYSRNFNLIKKSSSMEKDILNKLKMNSRDEAVGFIEKSLDQKTSPLSVLWW